MSFANSQADEFLDGLGRVLAGVRTLLARGELDIPVLPRVAVRVVGSGTDQCADAEDLANIIKTDESLAVYILRIAASAAERPAQRILSLQHALAWLGVDEVANIAFTLALQARMLGVKGQQRKARRLWRHSLASALWARQLARMASRDTAVCYLAGLLHEIGKAIALGAVHEVAQRGGVELAAEDYDRLVEGLHEEIGVQVMTAWTLPAPVPSVIAKWRDYSSAGAFRWESNVVSLAHLLADCTLREPAMLSREALIGARACTDLGLRRADAQALFDLKSAIDGELDMYLAP